MKRLKRIDKSGKIFFGSIFIIGILLIIAIGSLIMEENAKLRENESTKTTENSIMAMSREVPEEQSWDGNVFINEGLKVHGMLKADTGYVSVVLANGGLTSNPNSYYWDAGLNVTLEIVYWLKN